MLAGMGRLVVTGHVGRTVRVHEIATQRLENKHPEEFYDETYSLPAELVKDKQSATIKFQAHEANFAGGVFGLRIMKAPATTGSANEPK